MKKLNILSIFNFIYMSSTLLTVFIFCSTMSPVFAKIANEQLSCISTHRGVRCKSIQSEVFHTARSAHNTLQGIEICTKSARGTRCHAPEAEFIVASSNAKPN